MEKDYYKILGITKSASKEDVKKAFRKLAHSYHPDKPGGNVEKFKEASEAYSVLGDEKKRAEYDAYGRVFSDGQTGGPSGFGGFSSQGGSVPDWDFSDIFSEFSDFFRGQGGNSIRRGRDISIDIEVSFKESVLGTSRSVLLTKSSTCKTCSGSGAKPDTKLKSCSTCNGRGKIHETKNSILGAFTSVRACEICHGSGKVPEVKCNDCKGAGVARKEQEISITVPAGVNNGEMIRLTGAGEAVPGGVPGDLYVKLHVQKDSVFTKEGANLRMTLSLKLSDALLGSEQSIEVLGETILVKTPACISHGEILRVKGKGVSLGQNKRGDLLITIEITLPKKLSKKVKKLIEDIRDEGI